MIAISDIVPEFKHKPFEENSYNIKCIILKQKIRDLKWKGEETRDKRRAIAKLERQLFELHLEKKDYVPFKPKKSHKKKEFKWK